MGLFDFFRKKQTKEFDITTYMEKIFFYISDYENEKGHKPAELYIDINLHHLFLDCNFYQSEIFNDIRIIPTANIGGKNLPWLAY